MVYIGVLWKTLDLLYDCVLDHQTTKFPTLKSVIFYPVRKVKRLKPNNVRNVLGILGTRPLKARQVTVLAATDRFKMVHSFNFRCD